MMHYKIITATCLILLFQSAFARGVTMRYALVIGNNIGVDEDGTQPFPALMHAEQEAKTSHQCCCESDVTHLVSFRAPS